MLNFACRLRGVYGKRMLVDSSIEHLPQGEVRAMVRIKSRLRYLFYTGRGNAVSSAAGKIASRFHVRMKIGYGQPREDRFE